MNDTDFVFVHRLWKYLSEFIIWESYIFKYFYVSSGTTLLLFVYYRVRDLWHLMWSIRLNFSLWECLNLTRIWFNSRDLSSIYIKSYKNFTKKLKKLFSLEEILFGRPRKNGFKGFYKILQNVQHYETQRLLAVHCIQKEKNAGLVFEWVYFASTLVVFFVSHGENIFIKILFICCC